MAGKVYNQSAHKNLREILLTQLPAPCPICGKTMTADMRLDLDHEIPVVNGGMAGEGRLTHAK